MSRPQMSPARYIVRAMQPQDFSGVTNLCRSVYPEVKPWREDQLNSHHELFESGQLIALDTKTDTVVGYAASLILKIEQYGFDASWRRYTNDGLFTNHDPVNGNILYGAEVMVDPHLQGSGIGSLLYRERALLARDLKLRGIRAGARLRGYHRYASVLSAGEYVHRVVYGRIWDPTLSFQLRKGFKVLGVAADYLFNDSESLGHAAVVEWRNADHLGVSLISRETEGKRYSEFLKETHAKSAQVQGG